MRSVILAWLLAVATSPGPVDARRLRTAALAGDWRAVQALGPGALPELVRLYEQARPPERATIAQVFYNLGWKSEEPKHALIADAHTDDRALRRKAAVEVWRRWLAEYRASL